MYDFSISTGKETVIVDDILGERLVKNGAAILRELDVSFSSDRHFPTVI